MVAPASCRAKEKKKPVSAPSSPSLALRWPPHASPATHLSRFERHHEVGQTVRGRARVGLEAANLVLRDGADHMAQYHAGLQVHQQVFDGCVASFLRSDEM